MDFDLYYAAVKADSEWQSELEKMYGSLAGDARYTRDGIATPRLRELAEAKHIADALWRADVAYHVEKVCNSSHSWEEYQHVRSGWAGRKP